MDAVEPSPHDPAKAYACILRYQLGDWKPYIYKTTDYGKSWTLITTGDNGIPADYPVRVVREDPEVEGMLFAGTEYGVFASMDDGETWKSFQQNMPVTPITDMKITRGDLVLSTMGRGFWVVDNLVSLRQMANGDTGDLVLYTPKNTIRYRSPSGSRNSQTPKYPQPSVSIDYVLPDSLDGPIMLEIVREGGDTIVQMISDTSATSVPDQIIENMATSRTEWIIDKSLRVKPGLNRYNWDMSMPGPWHRTESRRYQNGPMALPGNYTVILTANDTKLSENFMLKMDPRSNDSVNQSDLEEQVSLQQSVSELLSDARKMEKFVEENMDKIKKTEKDYADHPSYKHFQMIKSALQTKKGIYEKPMLTAQLSYLYNMLGDADQKPGKDAHTRFGQLESEFNRIEGLMKSGPSSN